LDDNDSYFDNLEELELNNWVQPVDEDVVVDESGKGVIEGEEVALDDKFKPYVGLEFCTPDEAYRFYNNYACHVGFSVRKGSRASSSKDVSSIRFVCHKEEFSNYQKKREMPIGSSTNQRTPEKRKGIIRMRCRASCKIKLVKGDI
jgi:ribose 5-phosphate isomerase A